MLFVKKHTHFDHKYQKNGKSTVIIIYFFMSSNDTPHVSGVLCAYILKGFKSREAQGFFSSPLHPHHLSSSSTEVKMRGILSLHAFMARYISTGTTTLYTLHLCVEYRII
jgi:hypothetical protein